MATVLEECITEEQRSVGVKRFTTGPRNVENISQMTKRLK
jgi:hypothetical protein